MLCLCRGTGALRGFTLSNLENDQPSPELCQIIPCLSKVPPQRNGASGEAASHGTGLGIAPALAVASLQWHKRVLVSLDMHRDQEMDFIPVFCALLQEVMSSITLFLSGQGGNKVIGGNACLAPTWVFLVRSRTKSSCSTLREALHILTFLLACFCACSSLNFLLRWSAVLCAVAAMYFFYCQIALSCGCGFQWLHQPHGILYLVMHSGPSVTALYSWNPTSETNKSFLLCSSIHIL